MALTSNTFTTIYEALYRAGRLIGGYDRPTTAINELSSGVNEGTAYSITAYNGALATATSVLMFGFTASKVIHFQSLDVSISAGGWTVEIFEAPTVTANGTLLTPINLNFETTNLSNMTLYAAGTVSANGTLKLSRHIHVSGTGSANRVSSEVGLPAGIILKKNTKYMFKITNNSGSTAAYEAALTWLEK